MLLFLLSVLQVFIFFDTGQRLYLKLQASLLTFFLYIFFAQINHKLLKGLLVFSFLITVLMYPTLKIYGKPDLSYIASLMYTNTAESLSYIKIIPAIVFFLTLLLLLLILVLMKSDFHKIKNKYLTLFLLILLLFFPAKRMLLYGKPYQVMLGFYSHIPFVEYASLLGFLADDFMTQSEYIKKESQKPSDWKIINEKDKKLKDIFVVVIGESVRKDFLSSYGFNINNTPFINNTSHIQFNNFISVSFGTVQSLTRTLSATPNFPDYQLRNNIVNLAKKTGYETYWFSNQGQVGLWDSPNAIIAKSSDHYNFLKKGTSGDNLRISDDNLLYFFHKALEDHTTKSKFIILHLMGSHPSSCDRTEDKYDQFFLSQDISCYIKSIKNTDELLQKIHNAVIKKHEKSFNMIYFGDHGMQINSNNNITHGREEKQVYEVPLFIWGNDITVKSKIDAPRNGKDFLKLFSQLNHIKTNLVKDDYKFISNDSATDSPYKIIGLDEKITDYRTLKNNPIPKFKAP